MNSLTERFFLTIRKYGMLDGVRSVLIGYSGGADSSLLLRLFHDIPELSVTALHVHHGIRGEEADRDEAFCRKTCEDLGIPFLAVRSDVPKLAAEQGRGLEDMAREVRYHALSDAAARLRIDRIATAHNASDNAETVLFHLIRGAGLDGLCGIPPVRGNIIRPLIEITKEEISAWCLENGIPYVTDSTNTDISYSRNYIRREIIPRLAVCNPNITESLCRSAALLTKDKEYLADLSEGHSFSEGRAALSALPDAILSRVILRELRKEGCRPECRHAETILSVIRSGSVKGSVSVPSGRFAVDRDTLRIEKTAVPPIYSGRLPLHFGENPLPDGNILFLASAGNEKYAGAYKNLQNIYNLSKEVSICSAKIIGYLFVRGRISGDTYVFGGITRKVKKLLQSKKYTEEEKNRLPCIADEAGIVWIPGFPVCDRLKPQETQEKIVLSFFTKTPPTSDERI